VATHPNRSGKKPSRNPKPAEIREARLAAGLSQTAAGEFLYTTVGTWQQWESEEDTPSHRRMHPAFWDLFKRKVAELE